MDSNNSRKLDCKKIVRNEKMRQKYSLLSVEEKHLRNQKRRDAYKKRKLAMTLPVGNSRIGYSDPLKHLSGNNTFPEQPLTIREGVLSSQEALPRDLFSANQSKMKEHVAEFSVYERGSTSKSSFPHAHTAGNTLHSQDQPHLYKDCCQILYDAMEDLTGFPIRFHPSHPIGSNSNQPSTQKRAKRCSQQRLLSGKNKTKAATTGTKSKRGTEVLTQIADKPDHLPSRPNCKYCGAKKFYSETGYFCCSDGQVVLHENKLPDILIELFTGQSNEALCFRTYVRTYNNMFAFTSFGVHYDKSLCKRMNGIYTFKIQGQTYHFINQLIPHVGSGMYLQLYFHDTENELQNRLAISAKITESIVKKIMSVMESNPYACFFRSLRNVPDLDSYQIILKSHFDSDQRVFNKPTISQVAALWVEKDASEQAYSRHIQVYTKEGRSHRVQYYYGCYDPLQYPLLFPFGETGWHPRIRRSNTKNPKKMRRVFKNSQSTATLASFQSVEELLHTEQQASEKKDDSKQFVSMREYYAYRLQMREKYCPNILNTGRVLQQYVIDMYVKIETQRLDFFRAQQKKIRTEQLQGVMDSVVNGQCQGSKIGHRIILPASFIGGPRDMKRRYVDAMALVQRFGRPDLFVTMTCNPSWPEIKENLLSTDESQNRVDLSARIFHSKLEVLKEELFKKQIFGQVAAYTYVVEFQKRGLPHAHFLIILKPSSKLYSTDSYDMIVSAELPNSQQHPHLFNMVRKHMMHGPCGDKKPDNVCMQGVTIRKCKNKYPKQWSETTTHTQNSYPNYRRRNNGSKVMVRGHELDNRWVVPYNPYLLAKFNCHINVEICSSIKVVKYMYKYIYKGHDKIHFAINSADSSTIIDEITDYQTARWVSPIEAIWRIYRFPLSEIYPSVIHLQLHLENYQTLAFKESDDLRKVVSNQFAKKTMLTEFFRMNAIDEYAKTIKSTYRDFPQYFVWHSTQKRWEQRKRRDVIGRIVTTNPIEGERYFLRLLLLNVKAPRSFDDLKIINGNQVATFKEAAILRGYFESNNCQEECLEEASLYHMPYSLRRLFATLLVYFPPSDPRLLWQKFRKQMSEDFEIDSSLSTNQIQFEVLHEISKFLESMGKNINMYSLVPRILNFDTLDRETRDTTSERNILVTDEDLLCISKLNIEQKNAFDTIINVVHEKQKGSFFIDGPGGTGKTFLYKALLAQVRSKGMVALATASSGVAASLLPGGRTAHSRFKIPVDMSAQNMCRVSKQSSLAILLQEAKLIIWDEAPMIHRAGIEGVDNLLKDLMESTELFGGKVIVFGGDFRQVLPVIPKGSRYDSVEASLIKSYIWPQLQKLRLTQNMRAISDSSFSKYLLRVGNGTETSIQQQKIRIPQSLLIHYTTEQDSLTKLINSVYPDLEIFSDNTNAFISRAILTTKNEFVDEINDTLIQAFSGKPSEYISRNKTIDMSEQGTLEDFLSGLTPNGFPPHKLILKPNCPIILLRNIDPPEGLCNGTRLTCQSLKSNIIDAIISCGQFAGKQVFLHRICFRTDNDPNCPINFEGTQFPIRLCFAMTINKAQGQTLGQTLDFVGIYLREPVFSHGQLYVALSRAKSSSCVRILIKPPMFDSHLDYATANVVYNEVLELAGT